MSSPGEPPSAVELLDWNEEQIAGFLNTCRVKGNEFDISRVTDFLSLTGPQRSEFSKKFRCAALKAGPIDTNDLFKRLTDVRDLEPSCSRLNERSPTLTPSDESNVSYEAFCHSELVADGARPAVALDRLSPKVGDLQPEIAIWLGDIALNLEADDVPPILSRQLEDWNKFRQRWQWDSRGKAAGAAGFPAYQAGERRLLMQRGEVRAAHSPLFEEITKGMWDNERLPLGRLDRLSFATHVQAVSERLAAHHFTRPFQLLEEPHQQDQWTTWVEYLSYVYWWQDKHAAAMRVAQPRYSKAWKDLIDIDWHCYLSVPIKPVPQDLDIAAIKLRCVVHFLSETQAYRRAEAAHRREDLKARWVLEQLLLMEPKPCETAGHNTNGGTPKKRKREDGLNELEPDSQPKRTKSTRQKGSGDAVAGSCSPAKEGNGIAMASSEAIASAPGGVRTDGNSAGEDLAKKEAKETVVE